MDRRSFLAGVSGSAGVAAAGCITITDESSEHLRWSTSLDVETDPLDARGLAFADATIAAVSGNLLHGVSRSGEVRWEIFDYAGAVFGTGDAFLGIDWPDYHPRNEVNEAVLKHVRTDGDVRWSSRGYRLVDVAIGADRVFVLHREAAGPVLSARSLSDGEEVWTTPVSSGPTAVRLSRTGVIAFGDNIVAYDRHTGDERWETAAVDEYWPPAVEGGRIYLTGREAPYRVRILRTSDGRKVNEYVVDAELLPTGPLVVHDGTGFGAGYVDDESAFLAVDPRTGTDRWRKTPEDEITIPESPRIAGAFLDDTAFFFNYKYVLQAVDVADGTTNWTFDAEQRYPVVISNRETIFVLAGGTLHALGPATETQETN